VRLTKDKDTNENKGFAFVVLLWRCHFGEPQVDCSFLPNLSPTTPWLLLGFPLGLFVSVSRDA